MVTCNYIEVINDFTINNHDKINQQEDDIKTDFFSANEKINSIPIGNVRRRYFQEA